MMNDANMNFSQDRHNFIDAGPSQQQLYQQQHQQPSRVLYQNQLSQFLHVVPAPAGSLTHVVAMPGATQHSMLLPSAEGILAGASFHVMNTSNLQFQQQLQQLQASSFTTNHQGSLSQHQQPPQQQFHPELMQSLMDQKLQQARYEDQFRQRLVAAPADPLMQSPFIGEVSVLMGQNHLFGMNHCPSLPSPHELSLRDDTRRMRGGVIEPFPEKLHRLLVEVEQSGRSDVISFIANGQAFAIHKPDKFFKEIVPKYFRQSRLSSFKRQLNLYGFELINTGPARGGYYHEMFVKDRAEMCRRMRRVAVKLHHRQSDSVEQEDGIDGPSDFYSLPGVMKPHDRSGNSQLDVETKVDDSSAINVTSAMSA
jgi:hypothetical protein